MANLIQINGKKLKDSNAASMASLAPVESSTTASMAHAVGDYFWLNGTLYEATTSISIGNEISIGTNCKISKLAENVADLKSQITGMTTATAGDVGKSLIAKTVTNGEVTEWEFGEAVTLDDTLTQAGEAADAKAAGDAIAAKITEPATDGASGQVLTTDGNGGRSWTAIPTATDAQVKTAVDDWLDDHPEATTTVEDGSITRPKFADGVLFYITPEMFNAKGDGETDDTNAIQNAINYAKTNRIGTVKCATNKTYLVSPQAYIPGDNDGGDYEIDAYRHNRPGTDNMPYCVYVDRDVTLDLNNSTIKTVEDSAVIAMCGNAHLINGTVDGAGDNTQFYSPVILIHGGMNIHGDDRYNEEFNGLNMMTISSIRVIDSSMDSYTGYSGQCTNRTGILLCCSGSHGANHIEFCRFDNITVSNTYYGIRLFASDKNKNNQGYYISGNLFNHIVLVNNAVSISCEGNGNGSFTSQCVGNFFTDVVFQADGNDQEVCIFCSNATMNQFNGVWWDVGKKIYYLDSYSKENLLQFVDGYNVANGTDNGARNIILQNYTLKQAVTGIYDSIYATMPASWRGCSVGLQDNHLWRGTNLVASYTSTLGNTYDFTNAFNPFADNLTISANDTVEIVIQLPQYQWGFFAVIFGNRANRNVAIYCRKKGSSDNWEQLLSENDNEKMQCTAKLDFVTYNTIELKIVISVGTTNLYLAQFFASSVYYDCKQYSTWQPRILKAPNGNLYTLKVANDGALSAQRIT